MASLTQILYLPLLLVISSEAAKAQQYCDQTSNTFIQPGSILDPNSSQETAWFSTSKRFTFGFFSDGNGYRVGIYIVGQEKNVNVWTANRDNPPVSSAATFSSSMEGLSC